MEYLNKELILASASPRRKELLEQIGVPYKVLPSKIDEGQLSLKGEPHEQAERSALLKAKDVANMLKDGLVLGADTIVVFKNQIYGKPHNEQEAFQMLKSLSGNKHYVISGIAFVDVETGTYRIAHEKTEVYFNELRDQDIWWYINTKEFLGKAGSYGIQGKGAIFVEKIYGCYSNVVGLPLSLLNKMLKQIKK